MLHFFLVPSLTLLLTACQTPAHTPPSAEAKTEPATTPYTLIPLDRPWSSCLLPDKHATLLASTSRDSVDIFRITSALPPQRLASLKEAGFHPDGVATYDMNGDGQVELLVAAEGEGQVQIWQRQGDTFKLSHVAPSDSPISITAGDLDADGRADLVAGPYSGSSVEVFFAEADGRFSKIKLPAGETPLHPVIADWDGDGRPDILWSDWQDSTVRWARNLGQRRFDVKIIHHINPNEKVRMILVNDVDGDGKLDLVLPAKPGMVAYVLYSDGKGNIVRKEQIPAPQLGYDTAGFDPLTRTLVLAPETNSLVLAQRNADGTWSTREIHLDRAAFSPYFGDANLDGKTDLIFQSLDKIKGEGVGIIWGPLDDLGSALKPNPFLAPALNSTPQSR